MARPRKKKAKVKGRVVRTVVVDETDWKALHLHAVRQAKTISAVLRELIAKANKRRFRS